jgi:protein SCO1/2
MHGPWLTRWLEPAVDTLDERAQRYAGLGSVRAGRLRGFYLAQAEARDSRSVLESAAEALQSGNDAYTLAAGARALRTAARPEPWMLPLVERAFQLAPRIDDTFSLDATESTALPADRTTAASELEATRQWIARSLPSRVSDACCDPPAWLGQAQRLPRLHGLDGVVFEDHDANRLPAVDVLTGKPTIVVFFYTRCTNSSKCSLTITKLTPLRAALDAAGVDARVMAITYDPEYDTPKRLLRYAASRGVVASEECRLLRAVEGMGTLSEAFALGVNYGQGTVNHHRLELYVLDARGRVSALFTRLQWSVDEVVAAAHRAAHPSRSDVVLGAIRAAAAPAAVIAAFVPHCPLCWSMYATALGVPALAVARPEGLHVGAWAFLVANAIGTVMAVRRTDLTQRRAALTLLTTGVLGLVAVAQTSALSRGLVCVLLAAVTALGLRPSRIGSPSTGA